MTTLAFAGAARADERPYPFVTSATYSNETGQWMESADLNDDGAVDLVYSGLDETKVAMGRGDGTFTTPVAVAPGGSNPAGSTWEPGASLGQFAIRDLNGDSALDLAVETGAALEILLGSGDGGFAAHRSYGSAGESGLVAGDFDADGTVDLAQFRDQSVIVRTGNGDATFQEPVSSPFQAPHWDGDGSAAAQAIAAGDLNGDGTQDVVLSAFNRILGEGPMVGMLGADDGTFTQASTEYPGDQIESLGTRTVRLADVDADGVLDLLMAGGGSQSHDDLRVASGRGDGTFEAMSTAVSGFGDFGVGVPAAADVDGDGHVDVLGHVAGRSGVTTVFGSGGGVFGPPVSETDKFCGCGDPVGPVASGDFDGDGSVDVAYFRHTRQLEVQLNREPEIEAVAVRAPRGLPTLEKRGLKVKVRCLGTCRTSLRLRVGQAVARRAGLGSTEVGLTERTRQIVGGRAAWIKVKPTSRAARRLSAMRGRAFRLKVDIAGRVLEERVAAGPYTTRIRAGSRGNG